MKLERRRSRASSIRFARAVFVLFSVNCVWLRAFLNKREFRNNDVDEKKDKQERERGRDIHFSSTVWESTIILLMKKKDKQEKEREEGTYISVWQWSCWAVSFVELYSSFTSEPAQSNLHAPFLILGTRESVATILLMKKRTRERERKGHTFQFDSEDAGSSLL